MRPPRFSLAILVGCWFFLVFARAQDLVTLSNAQWHLTLDPASGSLVGLRARAGEPNWLREGGHWDRRAWVASPDSSRGYGGWGLVESKQTGLLHLASFVRLSERVCDSVYESPCLTIQVHRELEDDGCLSERYSFRNTSSIALHFPVGSLGIHAPLFDQYPDSERSLVARCHVHLWMGGASSWIEAIRMNAQGLRLGLVLSEGSLAQYSQYGGYIGERGLFLLHPSEFTLQPGQTTVIAWRWFWNEGWDDFFTQAGVHSSSFVRLSAESYVVSRGESILVHADAAGSVSKTGAALLNEASMTMDGEPINFDKTGGKGFSKLPATKTGEHLITLRCGNERSWLRVLVVPSFPELLEARLRFILAHQQRNEPGQPLDGAYLAYDNDTERQVYEARPSDHNASRERLAMGVLGAMAYRYCEDATLREQLRASLIRYSLFVQRELEDDQGVVYSDLGRRNSDRLYNFPWFAEFHLEMYRSFGDIEQLDRMVKILRCYYARGGARFYGIGLPLQDSLLMLARAGRMAEQSELAALFRSHADQILRNGSHYPAAEVNFEQSIVAPGAQILLEAALAFREERYLAGAREQLRLLEAFAGRQPDHHLYEIPIRHWDDYWFGKLHLYGDTFPHYWSSLNGLSYAYFAKAAAEPSWFARADAVLRGNLSLFSADGRASCVHVYPLTLNGEPAARNDPWANDQDWALVHFLRAQALRVDR